MNEVTPEMEVMFIFMGLIAVSFLFYIDWRIALAWFFMSWSNNMMLTKQIQDKYKKKEGVK